MANIFISHSKRDEETVAAFCQVFAQTTIRATLEEFEKYVVPPWAKIKYDVQQASAVFVLLSPHLSATAYTQNWVSYEVGLACALDKPVWIYEQVHSPVPFPIPYLTDYVLYSLQAREHLTAIKGLVELYDPTPSIAGLALGGLIGGVLGGGAGASFGALIGAAAGKRSVPGIPVQCNYQNCGVSFRLHTGVQEFQCPSCRQMLHFT